MAETTQVAAKAAKAPTGAQIERAKDFAREPFLLDGEKLKDLVAGSARRMALDAALAELDAGRETPSIEWRGQYSLMLGLERVLSEEVPKLADGAELNPHQVDALSGTLAALITEIEGEPGAEPADSNGADPADEEPEARDSVEEAEEEIGRGGRRPRRGARRGRAPRGGGRRARPRRGADGLRGGGRGRRSSPARRSSTTPAPAAASGSSTPRAPARPSPPSASSRPPAPAAS